MTGHQSVDAVRAHHLHRVAAARLGQQGVDRHDQGVGHRAGGDRHVHRRLVPGSRGGRVGRVHQHRDGAASCPSFARRLGSSQRCPPRRSPPAWSGCWEGDDHLVADGHLGLLGGVQGDADLTGGRGGREHRLARLGRSAQSGRDGSDPHRRGFEHRLTQRRACRSGSPRGVLELLDAHFGPVGELIRARGDLTLRWSHSQARPDRRSARPRRPRSCPPTAPDRRGSNRRGVRPVHRSPR